MLTNTKILTGRQGRKGRKRLHFRRFHGERAPRRQIRPKRTCKHNLLNVNRLDVARRRLCNKTRPAALRNGPFRHAKRVVSQRDMCRFAMRYAPFRRPEKGQKVASKSVSWQKTRSARQKTQLRQTAGSGSPLYFTTSACHDFGKARATGSRILFTLINIL